MKQTITRKLLVAIVLLVLFGTKTFAYEWAYIYVSDPQEGWWSGGPGSIDEAIITVHPQGAYTEIGMYLTFSAKGLWFTNEDTVEVVMDFTLPEGCIVHDSWLWVNDSIVKADIIDRWTATTIYEEIVGRRQDPSILYKNWNNNYQLRIFPMAGLESRKVKISYLVPNTWNASTVLAKLPVEILKASEYAIENISIKVLEDDNWTSPTLEPSYDISFVNETNGFYRTNKSLHIDDEDLASSLMVEYQSPVSDGVFLSTYSVNNENYYNMVILPNLITEIASNPKKVLILVDFDDSKTNITREELYENLIYILKSNINSNDSFNVAFSGINTEFIANEWLELNQPYIDHYMEVDNQINSYSNLPSLLSDGINFIKENGNEGEIYLISDNDNVGESEVANDLMDDLIELMDNESFPIHVLNYISDNYSYYFYNGNYYRGSEYFFINITKLTGGNFYNYFYWENDFLSMMNEGFQSIGNFLSSVDLHTYTETGFCHSRYDLLSSNAFNLNQPIVQVGKLVGEIPFHIQFSGVNNDVPFNEHLIITSEQIIESDTLLEESWVGNYIADLEERSYTNEIILEIIDKSIANRVLSRYTAFLAIDPALIPNISGSDDDGGWTDIKEDVKDKKEEIIDIYPNPFIDQLTLSFNLNENDDSEYVFIEVYNITGQLIWNKKLKNNSATFEMIWDGKDNYGNILSPGAYLIVIKTKETLRSTKVLKQ